jgi:hypothetical protein
MEGFKLDIKNKDAVIKWLEEIRRGSGDATPLWVAVTPKIVEFVDYEFHPTRDTHKLWPRLSVNYLIWKIRKHHVSGIGYKTGVMKDAASKNAIKLYKSKSLTWQLNSNAVAANDPNRYDYSKVFHFGTRNQTKGKGKRVQKPRPIYKYTAIRLNNFLKLDAKTFNSGVKHANFTYSWLRKSLEAGYK